MGVGVEVVEYLQDVLASEDDMDFADWFEAEYPNLTPRSKDRDCWEHMLG